MDNSFFIMIINITIFIRNMSTQCTKKIEFKKRIEIIKDRRMDFRKYVTLRQRIEILRNSTGKCGLEYSDYIFDGWKWLLQNLRYKWKWRGCPTFYCNALKIAGTSLLNAIQPLTAFLMAVKFADEKMKWIKIVE